MRDDSETFIIFLMFVITFIFIIIILIKIIALERDASYIGCAIINDAENNASFYKEAIYFELQDNGTLSNEIRFKSGNEFINSGLYFDFVRGEVIGTN